MDRHGLDGVKFDKIVSNPSQIEWKLTVTPSVEFYRDLHDSLKKKRVPMEEMGKIYRSIDPTLYKDSVSNKDAYMKIRDLISSDEKPSSADHREREDSGSDEIAHDNLIGVDDMLLPVDHSGEDSGSDDETAHDNLISGDEKPSSADHSEREDSGSDDEIAQDAQHDSLSLCSALRNALRRERRAKARIGKLCKSLKLFKRRDKTKEEKIERLTAALEETANVLHERNVQIRQLQGTIQTLEQTIDLDAELAEQTNTEYEKLIAELETQLQQECEPEAISTLSSRTYTTNVRALFYSLLSMRIPPRQIKTVVRNVISNLLPSVDAEKLRLPGKSCAAYMRSDEMPTISSVQKATELIQAQQWHLNSDGTTLQQQKKVAFLINGLVCGVHDVHDGSSQVAFDALKSELVKIGKIASETLPEENSKLDVTRIVSSTSDAASTQKRFTHLLEEYTGKKVVDNKCSMHLGVNLRLAQVKAVSNLDVDDNDSDNDSELKLKRNSEPEVDHDNSDSEEEDQEEVNLERNASRNYHDADLFVHEVAKLFGHLGTPEYAHGASSFRDFLVHKAAECAEAEREYFEFAQRVILERQVGSRYYVTSCNAGRIYFLRKAMVTFLLEQKTIKSLNRLESTCLKKLQDPLLLANLQLEGLMFDKVYADLITLVKSTDLNKSALDMNAHYLELLEFFQLLITKPFTLLDLETVVFKSEPLLYSASKLNHRLTKKYVPVRLELYQGQDTDDSVLLSMVTAASNAMALKLQTYMEDHLPGGQYCDPNPEIKSILTKLQPHNDKTESVFGANDWLNRVLPNMAQSTRSTMLEFTYNKTMEWLKEQGQQQKEVLVALAQERRDVVQKQTREEVQQLFKNKLEERKIIEKGRKKEQRIHDKIEDLKSDCLISSVEKLNLRVENISSLSIPKALQDAEIKKMVQRQVQLRINVFQQKGIRVNMTEKGKERPLSTILKELAEIIIKRPVRVRRLEAEVTDHQQLYVIFNKPSLLIGVKVKHRFEEGSLKWYYGVITSFRRGKLIVHYQETDETCQFSLEEIKEDFYSGDFYIL